MTQINTNAASYTPATVSSSSTSQTVSSNTGFASNDQYAAVAGSSAQANNPYAHVDWSKVNYDFSGVDWKSLNYNVGTQAASVIKPVAQASSSSQGTGYSTTDSVQNASSGSTSGQPTQSLIPSSSVGSSASAASTGTSGSSASGPGVWLTNSSSSDQTYSFYNNASNGNGSANPTYTDPTATETLAPGQSKFVSLPSDFKGRVQKTDGDASENTWATASTWAEFQLSASNDGAAHGDISYQTGFDGAATIASTDGSNQVGGTTEDLLADAPSNILAKSATGGNAIASNSNAAATAYLQSKVDESKAYTGTAGSGTDDVASKNNQLAITFY